MEKSNLNEIIKRERKIVKEMVSFYRYLDKADPKEERLIYNEINSLKNSLRKVNKSIPVALKEFKLIKKLPAKKEPLEVSEVAKPEKKVLEEKPKEVAESKKGIMPQFFQRFNLEAKYSMKDLKPTRLEKETIKRMTAKEKKIATKKEKKANPYIKMANNFFIDFSKKIVDKKTFDTLEKDLVKANLSFTPHSYISVIILSTIVSIFAGLFVALFFLFFKLEAIPPFIIRLTGEFGARVLKVFWIPLVAPVLTFLIMFFYPSLEKGSAGNKIDQELPFATIHMSAISGSMLDPSKIFEIIIMTKEYIYIDKEFTKLLNEINIYGYDLVSALRNSAANSPSRKLADLFNGLATTINSGGDLPTFFDKRAQTLLFEYGLEREKNTKSAETFMDIYISMVIAAPMILMILLMMMKISGLGIALSTSMITLVMVVAVTLINVIFLAFLQIKKG